MDQRIRDKVREKRVKKKEKNSHSNKKHRDFMIRRMMRGSKLGRQTEERVAGILFQKQKARELVSFERYLPNSPEDHQGKDFQVSKEINGEVITASFGITISMRSHQDHKMTHPNEPSIIIPPEMRNERIWQRICQILEEKAKKART